MMNNKQGQHNTRDHNRFTNRDGTSAIANPLQSMSTKERLLDTTRDIISSLTVLPPSHLSLLLVVVAPFGKIAEHLACSARTIDDVELSILPCTIFNKF